MLADMHAGESPQGEVAVFAGPLKLQGNDVIEEWTKILGKTAVAYGI